jgi:predicted HTH transcriptional regulator
MKCAIKTRDGEIRPTNVGILFFGKEPQYHIAQSEVISVLYGDELGIGGYIDRWIIQGTIPELIDEAETFLNRYIPIGAKIEGWKRLDLPDYPIEALREAIVNAVVHRDYSREGESIRVFYYSNRVEIHSPGLLLPGITIEQMERGEVMSKLRNPVLGNLLRDVPGYMERIGSGIRLMLAETRRMGLPHPQFREISEFIVTFRKAPSVETAAPISVVPRETGSTPKGETESGKPLEALTGGEGIVSSGVANSQLENQKPQSNREVEEGSIAATVRIAPLDLETRLKVAMRIVQENGYITNRQLRELTGVSEQTAMRDLETLADQGALVRVGKTRARRYKLP